MAYKMPLNPIRKDRTLQFQNSSKFESSTAEHELNRLALVFPWKKIPFSYYFPS